MPINNLKHHQVHVCHPDHEWMILKKIYQEDASMSIYSKANWYDANTAEEELWVNYIPICKESSYHPN
jgi:hypothetical protein